MAAQSQRQHKTEMQSCTSRMVKYMVLSKGI